MRFLAREPCENSDCEKDASGWGTQFFFSFFELVVGVNHMSRKVTRVYVCVVYIHFSTIICKVCVCMYMCFLCVCFPLSFI